MLGLQRPLTPGGATTRIVTRDFREPRPPTQPRPVWVASARSVRGGRGLRPARLSVPTWGRLAGPGHVRAWTGCSGQPGIPRPPLRAGAVRAHLQGARTPGGPPGRCIGLGAAQTLSLGPPQLEA
ncbi:hypothetical protein NDU88_004241 [Pleurodeles waltl]|uniref:Uncharacterized protein n=1 Tax=Pleurodeles waltl TaxID=8319 RepID=A0AAV7PGW5_PLEWA|nr:hypothetical protein NDU88_004241 [Pleurodeles waltl]